MPRAWLGLGANLGDPVAQVERALVQIAALPGTRLIARSALYRSDPVGPAGQPDYCNAVCEIETALAPEALLDAVLAIEVDNGRTRDGIRWTARRLDIDVLHVEGFACGTARLTLPHPRLQQRNWVAVPLAEIAPTLAIPGIGSITALADGLGHGGLRRWQPDSRQP